LGLSQPVVDKQDGFDQPHSRIRIRAANERAFGAFWGRVGEALDYPKKATTEEIGLTVVSHHEFALVRNALAKVHGKDKKPPRKPRYEPMFRSQRGGTAI
jgi:hypothetical protein